MYLGWTCQEWPRSYISSADNLCLAVPPFLCSLSLSFFFSYSIVAPPSLFVVHFTHSYAGGLHPEASGFLMQEMVWIKWKVKMGRGEREGERETGVIERIRGRGGRDREWAVGGSQISNFPPDITAQIRSFEINVCYFLSCFPLDTDDSLQADQMQAGSRWAAHTTCISPTCFFFPV